MKFEKLTVAVAATLFVLATLSEGVAANANTATKANSTAKKSTAKKSVTKKSPAKNSTTKQAKATTKKRATTLAKRSTAPTKKTTLSQIPGVKVAAVSPTAVDSVMSRSSIAPSPSASVQTSIPAAAVTTPVASNSTGSVGFTIGSDSNVDPDKTQVKATYFMINPALGYKNGGFSGNVAATLKDFSEQEKSNLYKQNEVTGSLGYKLSFTEKFSATSTLSGIYHDEMSPDYIEGTNGTPNDEGMPVRFTEAKFDQKLELKTGALTTTAGGSAASRNYTSPWTDFSDDVSETRIYEKDYNQYVGYASFTVGATPWLDLSLKPSVTHTNYTDRDGRQPWGQAGGETNPFNAGKMETINSALGFETAFKIGKSTITPVGSIGEVSDEALGAEDHSYYTVGLKASLVLHPGTSLTITPSITHKRANYDNWTSGIDNGEKRRDVETMGGIAASIKIAKNLGLAANYNLNREWSNKSTDTTENYEQEIASSTLTYSF
jgi:hypothetical protein